MRRKSTLIAKWLNQTAVYWGTPVYGGAGGRTFAEAAEISVRWEDKQEVYRDQAGAEHTSSAVVFVNEDLDLGGYLFLGELTDLASDELLQPQTVAAAREVRYVGKVPSVKADMFVRKVML